MHVKHSKWTEKEWEEWDKRPRMEDCGMSRIAKPIYLRIKYMDQKLNDEEEEWIAKAKERDEKKRNSQNSTTALP